MSRSLNADAIVEEMDTVILEVVGTEINRELPLMEAGLTSLGALQLGRALQGRLSVDVPATLVFDHPSLNSITSLVIESSSNEDFIADTLLMDISSTSSTSIAICAMALCLPVCI